MNNIRRQAVTVQNRAGETMYAVVSQPVTEQGVEPLRRKVVLFCQAGLQSKSGVGDYFRWLGDELTLQGYTVVRFDQSGTGDSMGELVEDVSLNAFFRLIQKGAFKSDTIDVMRWVKQSLRPQELYLWGQCGGCISAALACAEEPDGVTGLIMLVPPVLFLPETEQVREHDAKVARKGYWRKLLQPKSYVRFLSGKSEYALLRASALSYFRQLKHQVRNRIDRFRRAALPDHPMFNWPFWEAFQKVMRQRKPVLFLMAELDNETPEFQREFENKVLIKRRDYARFCTVSYLRQADHSLMFEKPRRESRDLMLRWLARPRSR